MIGSVLNITLKMLAISVIILNLIYMAYAPYDEYFNEKERTHERQVTKCKSIICLNMFLVLGFFFGKKYLNSAIITYPATYYILIGQRTEYANKKIVRCGE